MSMKLEWTRTGFNFVDEETAIKEWTGEGLPPVGTVCEWRSSGTLWKKCRIVGHDGSLAVLVYEDTNYFARYAKDLRPIKTPEQIAAEDRGRAIREMQSLFGGGSAVTTHIFETLHNAGYRKFEIVDE